MTTGSSHQSPRAESFASIWGRRLITIPLWVTLAVVAGLSCPIWGPAALLVDVVAGDRRLPRTRALAFFLIYLLCEAAGILAAGVLWTVRLGGLVGGPERYVAANAALQRVWSQALFDGASRVFGMTLTVDGAEHGLPAPFLLFVRHSSTADTVLAAAVIANPHRILLKYVIKRELLWDPCLDIVGRRLPNAFIDRSGSRTDGQTEAVAGLARSLDASSAVLIYPEGTRFGPGKRDAAVEQLRVHGHDDLADIAAGYRNVLPPRRGGVFALLDAAPDVDVVFLDHSGFEGARSFQAFWSGALIGRKLVVRLRRVRARNIPIDHRDRWLFEQWRETDQFVSAHVGTK